MLTPEQVVKPIRVQRRRGQKLPPNTVYVGRPTVWGNPFKGPTREEAIEMYRADLEEALPDWSGECGGADWAVEAAIRLPELRGKNLACWCPLNLPCHADVLLELANQREGECEE
jgi:hypothetical protein